MSQCDIEPLSTGSAAILLIEVDLSITEVSDYTCFLEMMDKHVKTLHPKIHGNIPGCRDIDDLPLRMGVSLYRLI